MPYKRTVIKYLTAVFDCQKGLSILKNGIGSYWYGIEPLNTYQMKTKLPSTKIFSSYEIEIHYLRPLLNNMYNISCVQDAEHYVRQCISPKQLDFRECFWVILMTNTNRVLAFSEVATGTTTSVQTNIKYIFQLGLATNASSIILVHNHPSGSLHISKKDIQETKKIKRLAKLMEITVLDHLIITSESYVSFICEGIL